MKQKQTIDLKRANLKKYAFVLGSAATLIARAGAQTIAQFTFENSYSTGSNGATSTSTSTSASSGYGASTGATSGMLMAEVGLGTAVSVHASASTVYSFPSGNGSSRAFSANNYTVGDYFQFTINATNYTNLTLAFDMTASATGPNTFNLQYSTDGVSFTNYATTPFTVSTAGFSPTSGKTTVSFSFDLSGITALNNTTDYFRIADASSGNANTNPTQGTVVATGGTARVDNLIETGTLATAPEPSSLLMLSVAGAGAVMMAARRRKRAV